MKKPFILFSCLFFLALMVGCVKERTANVNYYNQHNGIQNNSSGDLMINEFCARGSNYLVDELNPASDHWIEFYNTTSSTINFDSTNYYVSVNAADTTSISTMTKLVHFSVPAHGWIVVFADDSDRVVTTGSNQHQHIPHISKQGGFIGLYSYNPASSTLTKMNTIAYDSIAVSGTSWGLCPDGGSNWQTLVQPTPDATNATSCP